MDRKIIKITAIPNLYALNYHFIGIVCLQIQLAYLHDIAETLAKLPNVTYLANVTGRYDFLFIVATKSSGEFAEFMENVVSKIQGIIRTETFVSLHGYKGEISGIDPRTIVGEL
jgi:Lrp/AsnC family transcriptional regulator, regulator for asnA, asnC and gidA